MSWKSAFTRVLVSASLLAVGCEHEITSPGISATTGASAVVPDLVCVEQLATKVTIQGGGFTPMPTRTLEDKRELVLPQIRLTRTVDVAGAAATGDVLIPDSAADPTQSHVHWTSEKEMAFDVVPDLSMAPGLYDISVTNPDGKAKATFKDGMLGVPRPSATAVVPDILCVAQHDEVVTLQGSGFLDVAGVLPVVHGDGKDFPVTALDGCSDAPTTQSGHKVRTCTSATFTIPQGAFDPGAYDLTLTNPETAACVSTEKVTLTIVPPPTVASIAPDLVCDAQSDRAMVVTGTGFLQIGSALPTIALGATTFTPTSIESCTPVPGTFAEGAVQTCATLKFTIPLGKLPEGDYAVVVTNPEPADCKSEEVVNLHVAPPPSISTTATLAICDAQSDQTVTITGTKFLQIGALLPGVTIDGQPFTPTAVGGCTPLAGTFTEGVVNECTSITVVVPQGTFPAGDYPVVVQNPDPAGCTSIETVMLHVEPPPTVTGVVPATVCSGGKIITIDGTGFLGTPTVTLESSGQATVSGSGTTVNAGGTQLTTTMGPGAAVGSTYDVVVTNPDGCFDEPPHQTVTVVPGPTVYLADPEVVYNGINTRVTLYATGLTLPLPANAVSIRPAGQPGPVTQLTWAPVAGKPNRVQVIVPIGQAPGKYDLTLSDASSCDAFLLDAIRVTADLSVSIDKVVPPFGWTSSETAITIFRDTTAAAPADLPFVATPRAFLNPTNPQPTDVAIPLESVAFVDLNTLTAVVPDGQPVHAYDLIVVNPDGTVGLKANAFSVNQLAPPTVDAITPSSIVAATGQTVSVAGKNFRGSQLTLTCVTATGAAEPAPAVTSTTEVCDAQQNCTQSATINGGTLAAGSVCVLRLTNGDDASYFDYSAIGVTNSSLNLSQPKKGPDMSVGRRALVAAAGDATTAARFVYAIGGDGGLAAAATPFASVEFASVDPFGNFKPWQAAAYDLGTGRSFAASAKVGRYFYVMGGSDGSAALATAQRAMILSPREVPTLDVDDIVPDAVGLDPGYWFYRVSATFAASDVDNPGGESLPSDEFPVKVPTVTGKKIQVVLRWTAPTDSLGVTLPNITGYRVYRTPAVDGQSGTEVLIATTSDTSFTFRDDGTATPGTETPLPLGSTGKWATLPTLGSARKGAGGAAAVDPADPSAYHVYALLGLDGANAPLATYEHLTVTVAANGHQTFAAAWTPGTSAAVAGRWQLGAWVVDASVSSSVTAPESWVYLGGGIDAATVSRPEVEAGKVAPGGDLGVLIDKTSPTQDVSDFNGKSAGYGLCAANGELFTFGGLQAQPSSGATAAVLLATAPYLPNNAWNSEGLNMTEQRYLMGSSVQSAFIFLVGGQTATAPASATMELVIW